MPATKVSTEPNELRMLAREVTWDGYEVMLQIVGERRIRVTYDSGSMEVSLPSQQHERAAQLLGLFVPRLAQELDIECEPLGMTTWRKSSVNKGIEADQCYYIKYHDIARRNEPIDLEADPPPELAIEVDITPSSLDRMAIYVALGVSEVWRFDGTTLTMNRLRANARYESCPTSLAFPELQPSDVERFIALRMTTDNLQWARELRKWVRDDLRPRCGLAEPPT